MTHRCIAPCPLHAGTSKSDINRRRRPDPDRRAAATTGTSAHRGRHLALSEGRVRQARRPRDVYQQRAKSAGVQMAWGAVHVKCVTAADGRISQAIELLRPFCRRRPVDVLKSRPSRSTNRPQPPNYPPFVIASPMLARHADSHIFSTTFAQSNAARGVLKCGKERASALSRRIDRANWKAVTMAFARSELIGTLSSPETPISRSI
jgi:hypothetical protein